MLIKQEEVILVDINDAQIGVCEKLEAHQKALLHRAFSIFIFNAKQELILQKRALSKYHSGGLWTNTCCGHPRPGEHIRVAAQRRLKEEMGLICELEFNFSFMYKVQVNNDLWEHEFDHVFIGKTSELPLLNSLEVADWKVLPMQKIKEDLFHNSKNYTAWFKLCIEKMEPIIE